MKQQFLKATLPAIVAIVMLTISAKAEACTRVVYKGPNGTIITARSMDFLWRFPQIYGNSLVV